MDSHKTYKKLITWFWMIFASLPLIVLLVTFIGQFFINFGDNPFYNNSGDWDEFFSYFSYNANTRLSEFFYGSIPNFILNPILDLFVHGFNLSFGSDLIGVDFAILQIGWFAWTFVLIVITDLLLLFPKFAHRLLSKWGDFE